MSHPITGTVLGLASIGIGLTEIVAPDKVEKLLGISNGENTGILRVLGIREIMTGVDLLTHDNPAPGVWGRVLGDALDLALLGLVSQRSNNPQGFKAAFGAVAGITALDVLAGKQLAKSKDANPARYSH